MGEIVLLKIVKFFLENPYEELYLRQIAKKLKISVFAAKKYLDLLVKEGLIADEKKANLRYFKANSENLFFKQLKISHSIDIIIKSNLIEFLKKEIANISSIVLYGSLARGEDMQKSDIDLLIIGKEKYLNTRNFEEKIGKEITLHTFTWSEWNKQAKNNKAYYMDIITQGISLYGELPIVN